MPELRQRNSPRRSRLSGAAILLATALLAAGPPRCGTTAQPRASPDGRISVTIPCLQVPVMPGMTPDFVYFDQVWDRGPHLDLTINLTWGGAEWPRGGPSNFPHTQRCLCL